MPRRKARSYNDILVALQLRLIYERDLALLQGSIKEVLSNSSCILSGAFGTKLLFSLRGLIAVSEPRSNLLITSSAIILTLKYNTHQLKKTQNQGTVL